MSSPQVTRRRRNDPVPGRIACALAAAALVSACATSHARAAVIVLPVPSASAEVQAGPIDAHISFVRFSPPEMLPLTNEASNDGTYQNPGHAFARAVVSGGLDPVVSVSVTAVGETFEDPFRQGSFLAGASAVLDYSLQIIGPDTDTPIPVLAQGSRSISQNIYTGFSSVQISTVLYINNGSVLNTTGGDFAQTIYLYPGAQYNVHMEASAVVTAVPEQAEAIAIVDPLFTIDPAYSGLYTLDYSPGLIVPEPGSLALLATSLTGLLFARPRRKRG